jgi:hypothetical protein
MNWGKWIIVSFVLFAAFIVTLVTVCMRQEVSLVSKDYYKDELAYQQQITRMQNTDALAEKPSISVEQNGVQIQFTQLSKIEKGSLVLFCPSNPKQDRTIAIEASASAKKSIAVNDMKHGMYHAKFFWTMDGKDFYIDKTINL